VRDNRNPLVTCVVEPRSGYAWHDPDPASEGDAEGPGGGRSAGDEVLVVGAGPAGLECARVLASWGRAVVVAERERGVGGWPVLAALAAGRGRLALASTWLEAECRRLGIRIELGHEVTPEEAEAHPGPVVACSGGRDRAPDYEVSPGSRVVTAARLIASVPEPPAGPVTVWDPVGGPIAVAVAEELAKAGFTTTLLTPDVVVGTQLSLTGDLAPANVRLQQAGVRLVKRAVLRRVEPGRVVAEDRFAGVEIPLDSAWLVDCGHRLPDPTAWPSGVIVAGDAVAPRTIHEAVLEGRRAALAVLDGAGAPSGSRVGGREATLGGGRRAASRPQGAEHASGRAAEVPG
jgi:2,4-dienoyl-CoA reductase (NADPH2)